MGELPLFRPLPIAGRGPQAGTRPTSDNNNNIGKGRPPQNGCPHKTAGINAVALFLSRPPPNDDSEFHARLQALFDRGHHPDDINAAADLCDEWASRGILSLPALQLLQSTPATPPPPR